MNLWLAGFVFVLGGLVGFAILVHPFSKGSVMAKPGTFKVKKDLYTYEIGDGLIRIPGVSVFSGMDVHTAKRLPHIFVDAYSNDEVSRPDAYVYERDVRVRLKHELEGHVQVFAAKGFENFVHKIFTGGVLDTLRDAAYRYDIEIAERHIRLIVPSDVPVVSHNQALQHDLLKVAKTLAEQVSQVSEKWDESRLDQTKG
ncbi:MAG TPA: hypothetical protein VIR03_01165 [Candidatus Saccharimonadales bacterium]